MVTEGVTLDGQHWLVDGSPITMRSLIERFCIGTDEHGVPDLRISGLRTGEPGESFVVRCSVALNPPPVKPGTTIYLLQRSDADLDALAGEIAQWMHEVWFPDHSTQSEDMNP